MFVITLDAVVVNVALPSISADLGGGMTGLQWVADSYTLMFAALLLSSGAISDRIGARNAFIAGVLGFVVSSALCGVAPNLPTLIAARFVQGATAALVMPSSIALLGQVFPESRARARAVGIWAMGGAIASTSGPVLGGVLTTVNWRWIFSLNVPVGLVALGMLLRTPASTRRTVPLD
jgi:MFS family permease